MLEQVGSRAEYTPPASREQPPGPLVANLAQGSHSQTSGNAAAGGQEEGDDVGGFQERRLTVVGEVWVDISETLRHTGGNKIQAASLPGISARTICRKQAPDGGEIE